MENLNGRGGGGGGLTIMEFRGNGGVMHFGISEGIVGLKYGSRPPVGTDIFWNRPFSRVILEEISELFVRTNKTVHNIRVSDCQRF